MNILRTPLCIGKCGVYKGIFCIIFLILAQKCGWVLVKTASSTWFQHQESLFRADIRKIQKKIYIYISTKNDILESWKLVFYCTGMLSHWSMASVMFLGQQMYRLSYRVTGCWFVQITDSYTSLLHSSYQSRISNSPSHWANNPYQSFSVYLCVWLSD